MNYDDPRRWWTLGALALSMLVVGLDSTILSVALPDLATDLHASTGQLQWITNAYTLVLAALLLPAGLLGDRYGRKRLLLVALAVFGLASAACAAAPSAGALIAGRAVLGLGAAFLMPLSMSVLTVVFSPEERPRALGIWVMATAISLPIGPILGGFLLDHFWWGSIFLINVPVVLLGLAAIARFLPESRSPERPSLDLPGVLASGLGLATMTYGLIEAGSRGWGDARALTTFVAGLAILAGFLLWQRRLTREPDGHPLVDLRLFRSASFGWSAALATVVSFGMFGILFVAPQYFQAVQGADALSTGLRLLPLIGGLVVGSRIADKLAVRAGVKTVAACGLGAIAAGLLLGSTTGVSSAYGLAAGWLTLCGLGIGLALPTLMDTALGALPPDRSGVGSGLLQAVRQVGGAVGVAVLGSVLNAGYRGQLALPSGIDGATTTAIHDSAAGGVAAAERLGSPELLETVRASFVDGLGDVLLVAGGVTAVAVLLAVAFLPHRAVGHAEAEALTAAASGGASDAGPSNRAESEHDIVV